MPAGTPLSAVTTQLTGFGRGLGLSGTPTSWLIPNLHGDRSTLYNIYCNCLQSGAAGGPGDFTLSSITNGNARGNNRARARGGYRRLRPGRLHHRSVRPPLRGNIGLRYVKTDLRAEGYQALGGGTLTVVEPHPMTTGCLR